MPTYVSLDLEFIDANLPSARIIEVGAVRFDENGVLDEWSTLVNPGSGVSYAVHLLTGIESEELRRAPSLEQVVPTLRRFVGDDPIVGQSIELDIGQLVRQGVMLRNPLLDTFELATVLLPGLPSYDLARIAATLQVGEPQRHRAVDDAHLAREVFLALLGRIAAIDLDVLMHINRLTTTLNWPYRALFARAEQERRRRLVGDALSGVAVGAMEMGLARALEPPAGPHEPLTPSAITRKLDVPALERALGPSGSVARRIATYEERPEQLAMLRTVSEAFNDESHVVVEAGTGTGKSLAYLLPSLAFAAANSRRVVVSTNTINLQDQLIEKDVPDLVEAMGYEVRASVLKGRTNYLCLRRWLALLRGESFTVDEVTLLVKTLIWVPQTTSGDRAELRLTQGEEIAWSRICSQTDSCSPLTCPHHRDGSCFIARARRMAESSHIVVVNHALLISDLAINSRVIPEYAHLVVDEAHHLENEATAQLGFALSARSLLLPFDAVMGVSSGDGVGSLPIAVARLRLAGADKDRAEAHLAALHQIESAVAEIAAHGALLFESVRELAMTRASGTTETSATLRVTPPVRNEGLWQAAEGHWRVIHGEIQALRRDAMPIMEDLAEAAAAGAEGFDDLMADVSAALRQVETADEQGQGILANRSDDIVCWITVDNSAGVLHLAPLDVAAHVQRWLLNAKSTVVLTSATMSTDGSFEYIRGRLGIQHARELMLGSPFDYEHAALLLAARDLPEPNQPGYTKRAADVVGDVAEALGGRTLALFTSYAQLKATYDILRERMEEKSIVLMAQGIDGPRGRLLIRFRSTERALLLGTASFWEGVDVVGDALSALVIARLPFAVPSDPVFAARSEQFDDPFGQFAVPQAILRFKQGFGRLIRSRTDRGVAVVLDRRILSRSYGTAFLNSLPGCTVRSSPTATIGSAAKEWLETGRAPSEGDTRSSADAGARGGNRPRR